MPGDGAGKEERGGDGAPGRGRRRWWWKSQQKKLRKWRNVSGAVGLLEVYFIEQLFAVLTGHFWVVYITYILFTALLVNKRSYFY